MRATRSDPVRGEQAPRRRRGGGARARAPRGARAVRGQRRVPQRSARDDRRLPASAAGRARARGGRRHREGRAPASSRSSAAITSARATFRPAAGARTASTARPTLCALRDKPRWFMHDGTPRFKRGGEGIHHFLQVSGYATHAVLPEDSVIPDPRGRAARRRVPGELRRAGRRRARLNRAKVPPGASVAVFGCGGVGLNTIQAARYGRRREDHRGRSSCRRSSRGRRSSAPPTVVDASKEDPVARIQASPAAVASTSRSRSWGCRRRSSRRCSRRIAGA